MDDFLYNLRNSARKKTGDRRRKSFEANSSGGNRKNEREYPQENVTSNVNRILTNGRIDRLEKYLQEWIDAVKALESVQRQRLTIEERLVVSIDHIAGQLEKIASWGLRNEPFPSGEQRCASEAQELQKTPDDSPARESWSREEIVRFVQELHRSGMSEEGILRTLLERRVPTLNGKGTWRIQSVLRICRYMHQS